MDARRYDAMWAGWKAGLRGDDPRACPYEKMTAEWREWHLFHRMGIYYTTGPGAQPAAGVAE